MRDVIGTFQCPAGCVHYRLKPAEPAFCSEPVPDALGAAARKRMAEPGYRCEGLPVGHSCEHQAFALGYTWEQSDDRRLTIRWPQKPQESIR